ncbi:MAG TPA: type IIL restriction-modification enzyme MmeI [Hanamia sp.]|nr:type IIL restriction-modification enzyme MmeI [Hanamia sp.]
MPLTWNEIKRPAIAFSIKAQNVLDVRVKFPKSSLADLLDTNTMPPELVKAHQVLDKAVDLFTVPNYLLMKQSGLSFCLSYMMGL